MQIARSVHPLPGEAERKARLLSLVDAFGGKRVALIGDLIADEFIYGRVSRVSREAPVLILQYDATEVVAGGGGNAANNAAALGASVRLAGLAGRDEPGRRMLKSLHRGVDARRVLRPSGWQTPVKTRILAGGIHSAKQQVVRVDRERAWQGTAAERRALRDRVRQAIDGCDAVIVSDYGLGVVTPELVADVRALVARRNRRRRVPILIDSRYELLRYPGLTACTPNESEVERLLGVSLDDEPAALERAGRTLLRRTGMEAVLVTRGSRGMALFEPRRATEHIAIYGSDEIADVTGAGDTVIATMGLALACGASFYEAARLANYAGGLVVMKRGTATVSPAELAAAIEQDHPTPVENWSQEGPDQGRRS
ncbi:MAG: bifunctional hydroxymethylpyrimidine kinase/phosphomethylpyrimidine kinase [Acidobacteriota bacterium]|nr:bifunctional hydroxymethylpyrimidine kinase/phosphomethylpyrimidine kinase [Acidobacteriota bacterium]